VRESTPYVFARGLIPRREGGFTPARDDCPHPEWWSAIDRDSTEREVTALVAGFVRGLQPEYVIETGTAFAQTTRAIGRALKKNGHGRLVSLEVNAKRVRQARRLCARLPVDVVERSSLEFEPERPVDFAWFDSLPELRVAEFRRYRPWMHAGTVVGFHDTTVLAEKIKLEQLEDEGLLRCLRLPTPRGVVFGQPIMG
jgi:predicted O-methyltransferase YrrM